MLERINLKSVLGLLILIQIGLGLPVARAQTGSPGNALSLDGTTGDYVLINTFNGFPNTAFTIEFWMRTSDTAKEGTPFSYATSSEDNMFFIEDYRHFRFRLDGTAIPASGDTGVSANDNQWHHIAVTWNNSSGSFNLYRDGLLRYTATGIKTGFIIPSGGAVVIGQEQDSRGGGFQSSEAFLGQIDELRMWNSARSEFSIRSDMHRSLAGNTSGLLLYYRMDESSQTVMTDSSPAGHLGTLVGSTRFISSAPVGLPVTISTFPVVSVNSVGVTFRGSIDPNGLSSSWFFQYGTNGSQWLETPRMLASGSTATAINQGQGGLRPSTTYYYKAVGSNALGKRFGTTLSFSTFGAPSVTPGPATTVTSDSATLTANVNPRGTASGGYFQYGLTTNYTFMGGAFSAGAGTVDVPASFAISDLIFDTNYHYRCVASNSFGTTFGSDRTFRTQVFGDIGAGLTGVRQGDLAWGDYDNDGDLDLVISGRSQDSTLRTELLRNDGDGNFTTVISSLPAVALASIRWGDFNNDGWADLVLTGLGPLNEGLCQVWRNNGNGTFSDINADLPGVQSGRAEWGDYNNDGRLDLLITGATNNTPVAARLFRNNGNQTFSNVNLTLPALERSTAAWADYDNDGDLDFVLAGLGTSGIAVTQIRRNNGDGTFTDIGAGVPGVADGSVTWADYDSDGDLDLLITGTTNQVPSGAITQLWRNFGNGSFAQVVSGFPNLTQSRAAWGDFDNDGDLDLALTGTQTNVGLTELRRNNGDGTFTKLNASIPILMNGAMAWGDFDNDGDLDLAVSGQGTNLTMISEIRRNDSFPANTVPGAPSGLISSATVSNVVLSWSAATDAQTPSTALTYNVLIEPDITAVHADRASGLRRVPAMGNVQHGTNGMFILTNYPAGTYLWTVQAIDSAFGGGPFAPTNIIELPGRPAIFPLSAANVTTEGATLQALVNPGGRNTTASFDFGSTAAYGAQKGTTNLGNSFVNLLTSAHVGGLSADSVYHYRATAFNVFGSTTGPDVAFRTLFLSFQPQSVAVTLPPGGATNVSIVLSNHIAAAVNVTNRFTQPAPAYAAVLNPTISLGANGVGTVNLLLDATGLAPETYEATVEILAGSTHAIARVPVQLTVLAAEAAEITSVSLLANGSFSLKFTGTAGYTHTVLGWTNIAAPLGDWTVLGPATQVAPGQFEFTDSAATTLRQRFYQIRTH